MVSRRSRSSSADLGLIREWFDKCTKHHKRCKENMHSWFPTRLLSLGPKGRYIRLIITKDNPPNGPYMTLSHRWTEERYTKLQSSTAMQLQQAIDVVRLPKTFQDAVRVCRHLNIHYLWIDSLCIKQDENDLSDWVEESQRMGQVYSSACLNVSATRSFDGSGRLLGGSSWASKVPTQIEVGTDDSSQKYYVIDGDLWDDEIESAPLLRRAWVYQERYLAHRIIHFGESQLGWECLESRMLEMFPKGLPPSLGISDAKLSGYTPVTTTSPSSSTSFPDTQFAEEWQRLMCQYSKCELTYPSDKLIALDGIAKIKMMDRQDDTYVAGMWKSTALYDLPWWRWDDDRTQFPIHTTSFRAPSWSWASVDGDIHFPLRFGVFSKVQESYADVKTLVGHTTDQNGNTAVSGEIQIEGICLPLRVQWQENEEPKSFTIPGFRFSTHKWTLKSSIYLEAPAEVVGSFSDSGKLLLLPLFVTRHTLFGIVLATTHGISAHQRIGAIEIAIMGLTIPTPVHRKDKRLFIETKPQASTAFREDAQDTEAQIWSRAALKFIHYLREQRPHSRLITIL